MDTLQYFLLLVILLTLIQPACGKYIINRGNCNLYILMYPIGVHILFLLFTHKPH